MKGLFGWNGAKTRLIKELVSRLPNERIENYYEPFLGSGVVYFNMILIYKW